MDSRIKDRNATSKQRPLALILALNIAAAFLILILAQLFVAKIYQIPSGSMDSTLEVGDRIVANRIGLHFREPANGDIVVFKAAGTWTEPATGPEPTALKQAVKNIGDVTGLGPSNTDYLVKRIIGSPGDVVECCTSAGGLILNGEPLDEPYVFEDLPFIPGGLDCSTTGRSPRCFGPVTVPAGQYLVMGDHRSQSLDGVSACRMKSPEDQGECAKFVSRDDVVGRAGAVIWPLRHFRIN